MKHLSILIFALLLTLAASPSWALNFPTVLNDEMSQTALGLNTRKVTIVIHGWQPCGGSGNAYASGSLYNLSQQLKSSFQGTEWQLVLYRWEQDADTANSLLCNGVLNLGNLDAPSATAAANNALLHGAQIAQLLNQQAPNLRQVHIIAHSAGTWAAYQAAHDLLQTNSFVTIQVTILDGYVPGTGLLTTTTIESLATVQGNDRIFRLENYHSAFQNGDLADIQAGCNHTFNWRSNIDINLTVSFFSWMNGVNFWCYPDHDGPIDFYKDSILAALPIGQEQVSGCLAGESFSFTDYGFYKSQFYERYFLPVIASNPQSQSANSGASALLQVAASSSQAMSYQWFLNGQRINGATRPSYSFTVNSSTTGDYVVEVSNQYGFVFSDKATVNMVADAAPTTTAVSPTSLPTSSSTQLINIYGTNFKPTGDPNASTLIFRDPANNPYVRTPIYVSANQLQYNVTVQSATGTWSVIATNTGLAASNPQTFSVYTAAANTGSLVVNLSPAGASTAGAQWLLNGSYHNSGDVIASLTPGQYTVSFKTISGYTTPANQNVTINANAQTTASGAYSVIAPSTYTLTLNYNPSQGGASPSPLVPETYYTYGSYSFGYTANSITLVQASASTGYHFTGWSGDASGSANPITVTMNGNRNITANFAVGDPNLGTVTVTIQPPAAAAAGVTWGWNSSDYRASGSSVTTWPGTYILTIHPVDGWLGQATLLATITAGQSSNYTVTFTADTTPGLLTVALSPPDAVTAGAHWHVNGGAAQGSGATVSLSPGTYTVSFDSVSGWTTPPNQTVQVQRAQTTVVSANYTPPAGQPTIVVIHPGFGSLAGNTALTIEGVNFTAPATVLVGGKAATNVSVLSATQISCFTPPNSVYGTQPVIVQTAGGSATNLNGFAYGTPRGNGIDLVTSVGGYSYAVAVRGANAYVGEGSSFLVLDISNPASPSRVGRLAMPGMVEDIALLGQYAYVANGDGGLQVVDISNPAAPALKGFYAAPGWASGIAILGSKAYVADGAGLEIFDLGNPVYPAFLSSTNYNGAADDVAVQVTTNGVFAYLSSSGYVSIIDVSQPLSPTLHGHLNAGPYVASSIAISGNYLFASVTSDGVRVVNVSNVDNPVDLGYHKTVLPSAVTVANNLLYVIGVSGFNVFSFNGRTLVSVGAATNQSSGYNMVVSGNRAYAAGGANGFLIMDISNSANPSGLATFSDSGFYGDYSSVALSGSYLFTGGSGGLKVFDVNNPAQPNVVYQNSSVGGSQGQILLKSGFAYISGSGGINRIQVLNVNNPTSPSIIAGIPVTTIYPMKMALSGNNLLVAGFNTSSQARFLIADISNPSIPVIHGILDFPSFYLATSVAVVGNKAVIVTDSRLKVLDISNIDVPIQQGEITNVGATYEILMSVDGHYAYLPDRSSDLLRVLDVSNANSPVQIGSAPVAGGPWGITLQDNVVCVAAGWPSPGIYDFDVSNPATPTLIRSYHLPIGQAYGSALETDLVSQQGIMFVPDNIGGMIVLKTTDTESPQIFVTDPTFSPVYTNATGSLNLGGGASDNVSVTRVTWSNNRGGSGNASGTDSWVVNGITLLPGTNVLTVAAFDAAGNSGSDTLTVIYPTTNQNQTITFPAIADHTFGDVPIPLAAAASSGLPVSFSVVSGSASLSNNILTSTGAGAVTVQADQSGNGSFNPATPVDVSFNVARANQSIAFDPVPNHTAGDAPFALLATTSSGLPVYFNVLSGPAINSNNIVTVLGGGLATVIAWQPGNSNYNAAVTVQQSFTISKIPQTITFGALSPQKAGDAPFPLNATVNSGLLVSFSVSGPATLSGNIVTLAGHGTVNVTASQSGNNSYAAATPVIQSFSVAPPDNTLIVLGFQNRSFQMAFYGMAGSNYTVQASSNLLNWQPFTNFIITNLPYSFIDPATTNFNRRFYRAMP